MCNSPWDRSTLRRSFQNQGHSKDVMSKSNMCLQVESQFTDTHSIGAIYGCQISHPSKQWLFHFSSLGFHLQTHIALTYHVFWVSFVLEWFFRFFLSLLLDSLRAQIFLSTSWLHSLFLDQDQATHPQQECQRGDDDLLSVDLSKVRCTLLACTSWYIPDFSSVNLWVELDGRIVSTGLPWWLSWQRICPQCRRPGFALWVGKILWRRECLLTPWFLPGESPWIEGWLVGWRIPWPI